MNLRMLLKFQLVWVVLGLGYNGVSVWRIESGGVALSPTEPFSGAIFVGICGLIVFAGLSKTKRLYRFSAPCLALLLSYSGVGLHIINILADASLTGYASFTAWLLAVLINAYGVITLSLGSWLAWRSSSV